MKGGKLSLFLSWVAALVAALLCQSTVASLQIQYRQARKEDVDLARRLMLRSKMNPLSIAQEHLVVAYDGDDSGGKHSGLLGFGQIRPLTTEHSELASLYVVPQHRRQGVGSSLISELLERHDAKYKPEAPTAATKAAAPIVCLLTIRPTVPLYENLGFEEVQDITVMPPMLQFEYKAGLVVSKLLDNELVCMARTSA